MNRNASGYARLTATSIRVTGTTGIIKTSAETESKSLLFESPANLDMSVTSLFLQNEIFGRGQSESFGHRDWTKSFLIQGAVLIRLHDLADPQKYSREYIYLFKKNTDFKKRVHDFTKLSHHMNSLLYEDQVV